MSYEPKPIDTSNVELPPEIEDLIETHLAPSNHDNWAVMKMKQGYQYGTVTSDTEKTHVDLVHYAALSENKKEYDRVTSRENLKMLYALGYQIVKA